jgi:hypothetical protein
MTAVGETELDRYLRDLMAMVARATPGPFVIGRTGDRRYALTAQNGRTVAVVNRRCDAEIFARDRLDLRALVIAVAEVLGRHHDDGEGHCSQDGQPLPCDTRRELVRRVMPRRQATW